MISIVIICCTAPLVAACICVCGYRKYQIKSATSEGNTNIELDETRQGELVREIENAAKLELNPLQPSKSGLSAQDSLKIPPGLNDNYSMSVTGVLNVNIININEKLNVCTPGMEFIEGLKMNGLDVSQQRKDELKLDKDIISNATELSDAMYDEQRAEVVGNGSTKM